MPPRLKGIAADDFTAGPGADRLIDRRVHADLDEPDRAVAEHEIRASGMLAPETPLAELAVGLDLDEPGLDARVVGIVGLRRELRQVAGLQRCVDPGDLEGDPLRP